MNESVIDWWEEKNIFTHTRCVCIECSYFEGADCNTPCIGVNDEVAEGHGKFTKLVNLVKDIS